MKRLFLYSILTFMFVIVKGQNYQSLKAKEEFDLLNSLKVTQYDPCGVDPEDDADPYGDGMSYILDAYITMYKVTEDKAYLYKFIIQSLCMMENRDDYAGINSEDPRWSYDPMMYLDGYIIGAMAHFVYFIKEEEPSLQNVSVYQFDEIAKNSFNETFETFGQ